MNKVVFPAIAVIVSAFTFMSCGMYDDLMDDVKEALDILEGYEEELSLTSEEEDALLKGKWILNDAGYSLTLDDVYDVDIIDKDGYPEVDSAIESITIGDDREITFHFSKQVVFDITTFVENDPLPQHSTQSYRTYTPDGGALMKFGLDDYSGEFFQLFFYSGGGTGGSVDCYFRLYGKENRDEKYEVSRIIMCTSTSAGDSYYEFVPAKFKNM